MREFLIFSFLICNGCVSKRAQIWTEITAFGELPADSELKKLGVLWMASDKLAPETKMTLNEVATKMVDEARLSGIDAKIMKTDEDLIKLKAERGILAYLTFNVNEKSTYIPQETHTYTLPSTDYHSGSVNSYSTGKSYNYSGTTQTQTQHTYTTGGYTVIEHCRNLTVHFVSHSEIGKEKHEVSYLQKLKSCGSNSDIRKVASEMLESAFRFFGKSGQFKDVIYYEAPRGSQKRYK